METMRAKKNIPKANPAISRLVQTLFSASMSHQDSPSLSSHRIWDIHQELLKQKSI
jgi:hypothetical protein